MSNVIDAILFALLIAFVLFSAHRSYQAGDLSAAITYAVLLVLVLMQASTIHSLKRILDQQIAMTNKSVAQTAWAIDAVNALIEFDGKAQDTPKESK